MPKKRFSVEQSINHLQPQPRTDIQPIFSYVRFSPESGYSDNRDCCPQMKQGGHIAALPAIHSSKLSPRHFG